MEFDSQHETGKQNPMHIMPGQNELRLSHIIAIQVYDGHYQTLFRVLCEFVQSTHIRL